MKGYELHKTGARVNQLLERQFVVPTLDYAPNSSTTTWQDGDYVVTFRIGEQCRVKEDGEWRFYRLQDIENGVANWVRVDISEMPDLSGYYTKQETDEQIANKVSEIKFPDMSDYYTKQDTDKQIEDKVSAITFPEDESILNVTEDEYEELKATESLSDKTLYFVSKDDSPIALYIGKVQIAVREEGSKGFAYNFPIIF